MPIRLMRFIRRSGLGSEKMVAVLNSERGATEFILVAFFINHISHFDEKKFGFSEFQQGTCDNIMIFINLFGLCIAFLYRKINL